MTDSSKILLVIGYVWPEPDSSAAGSRMLQLLRAFQQHGYQVVYASPADDSDHAVDLNALDIRVGRIALNSASFDDFILCLNPSVVMFDRFMMEEQFGWRVEKYCPDALRILDSEDLHSLRHARHAMLKAQPDNLPLQPTLEYVHSDLAIREIAAILRCDLTLIISEFEMGWLQKRFQVPAGILHYCPFMQEKKLRIQPLPLAQRKHFISIGNFRHEPNWDAVRYLKEHIWAGIRQRLPDAQLHIYGAYPPKKATQLHNDKQGFVVKGWADNAHKVIGDARVMLAPLRFGAGLKGKLIDAAECGTPAVTTTIGAEGMYSADTQAAWIEDDPSGFIDAAVTLYQNESEWQHLSDQGQQLIPRRFDFSVHAPALMERLDGLEQNLQNHRQQNFYGMMLRHHSMKSTQYMAQWIEAKNRFSPDEQQINRPDEQTRQEQNHD